MDSAWIAVISALGASILTITGNIVVNLLQSKKEEKKEARSRAWAKEDLSAEVNLRQRGETFKIYNEVLREDGEHRYVFDDQESKFKEFDIKRYKEVIRPILFSNLHLLELNIIKLVRKLDGYLYAEHFFGMWEEWLDEMSDVYIELIEAIEKEYESNL